MKKHRILSVTKLPYWFKSHGALLATYRPVALLDCGHVIAEPLKGRGCWVECQACEQLNKLMR